MSGGLALRSLQVNDRRTSMRLEPRIWLALQKMAQTHSLSVSDIVSRIDSARDGQALTTAVRAYVVDYFASAEMSLLNQSTKPTLILGHSEKFQLSQNLMSENDSRSATITLDADAILADAVKTYDHLLLDWRGARRAGCPVSERDLNPSIIGPLAARGWISVIDVSSENPANYKIQSPSEFSTSFLSRASVPVFVGEFPLSLHSRAMQIDFLGSKLHQEPVYQVLDQQFGELRRRYRRLLLPVSTSGYSVDRLLSVIQPMFGPRAIGISS